MPFLGKVPSQIVDSDVDINGGTIDGATIGSITSGAGTFTNLSATGTITFPDDGISGDDINGGTISNFTSTGIDDNATSTAITIDASENVGIGTTSPAEILHVANTSTAGAVGLRAENSEGHVNFTTNGGGFQFETGASGAVANIDSSGNFGIGTTSPSNQLHIASSGSDFATLRLDAPSNTTPATFQIRSHDGDFDIRDAQNSATRMTIDSSGNVGIGTTSPNEKLNVSGNIRVTSGFLGFSGSTSTPSEAAAVYRPADNTLAFSTANTERVRVTVDGRVGIGTTSPTRDLQIGTSGSGSTATLSLQTSTTGVASIYFGDGTGAGEYAGLIRYSNLDNFMSFWSGSGEKMRLDDLGHLGIGTTSPDQQLHIHRNSSSGAWAHFTNNETGETGSNGFLIGIDSNEDVRLLQYENKDMEFYTSNTERMRITSDGKVGIGTSGPSFPLDIRGPSGGGDAVLRVHNQHTSSSDDAILRLSIAGNTADSIIQFGDTDDADAGRISYHHNGNSMRFFTGASEEMRLENDGDLQVDGSVVANSSVVSDERFKDNVTTITGALDTVDSLRGVTFTWNAGKNTGKTDYGFIAQEVEQVIPEIVHDKKLPLFAGNEDTVYKTVDYAKFCAVLVEAVSDLRAEVEAQASTITDLTTRLEALETN